MPTDAFLDGSGYNQQDEFIGTLEGLFRHGDLIISDGGSWIAIDLTVRASGCVLYGTGSDLLSAISDAWSELNNHLDAIEHLENLGVPADEIGRLSGRVAEYVPPTRYNPADYDWDIEYRSTQYDPNFDAPPLGPAFTELPSTAPALAIAGEPSDHPEAEPDTTTEALDTTGAGYILALLIPVRLSQA